MKVTYEHKNEMTFIGFHTEIAPDEEMCSRFGTQAGMTNEEMKAYCEILFPTLKRWKAQ